MICPQYGEMGHGGAIRDSLLDYSHAVVYIVLTLCSMLSRSISEVRVSPSAYS